MLPIADINGVAVFPTMSARLSTPRVVSFVLPVVIGRNAMFAVTNIFRVPNSSTEVTNSLHGVD